MISVDEKDMWQTEVLDTKIGISCDPVEFDNVSDVVLRKNIEKMKGNRLRIITPISMSFVEVKSAIGDDIEPTSGI
ncbi:MAG: hypothetical protein P4L76_15975 [Beijerinckiaceae bacterium]|nr:hypothetical protein [Beijerinckiaceae bacterium]